MLEVLKVVFAAVHRVMLLMSEMSKVHTGPSIQSNVTHVRGVESGVYSFLQSNVTHVRGVERVSKCTIRAHDCFASNFQLIFNPKKVLES